MIGLEEALVLFAKTEYQKELKRLRPAALHRMRKMGIDTADWSVVDAFCSQPRIAKKRFAQLELAELEVLIAKLEAIRRKSTFPFRTMNVFVNPNALPS